jgi:hypothetical protein
VLNLNFDLGRELNAHKLVLSFEVEDYLSFEGNTNISQELK